jgi:hypothetical protein
MPSRARSRRAPPQHAKSTIEAPEGSEPNYYGAMIRYAKPGPRRELILRIETWPKGRATFGGGDVVAFRFGAIVNYEEVRRFFVKVPKEGLHYLRELNDSNPGRHVIEMEFDRTAGRIRIIAGKVLRLAPKN